MIDQTGSLESAEILGEKSGHEEREISDVAVHFPLAVHRLGLEQDLRFEQQLDDCIEAFPVGIPDPVEAVGMGKLDQQIGEVLCHFEVRPTELLNKAPLREAPKELT